MIRRMIGKHTRALAVLLHVGVAPHLLDAGRRDIVHVYRNLGR